MSELREILAELEHKQWIKWSQAVADEVATSRRARWKELWIPYSALTEAQKDQDRAWADKILAAFKAHIKEYEIPGSPYFEHSDKTSIYLNAIEGYRNALMESLE